MYGIALKLHPPGVSQAPFLLFVHEFSQRITEESNMQYSSKYINSTDYSGTHLSSIFVTKGKVTPSLCCLEGMVA